MQPDRRTFLKTAGLGLAAASLADTASFAAERANSPDSRERKSRPRLGTVTYNLAKDWDLETILKNCEEARFDGVELRTTHAHKVEVDLTKTQRAEVKKRFQDSKVALMGLGSAFDYHTPDQTRLRKDIEATKEYIVLAHDVGASGVKVRPNGLPKEVAVEKTLEQIGKALHELGEFADGYGQQIRLEMHGTGNSNVPY